MSKFWFDYTKDIVPNHMLSTDVKDMPEFFRKPEFDGNSMECRKLEMLPIECIVRGYINRKRLEELSGKRYSIRGIRLPGRLRRDRTSCRSRYSTHPSTKAELGLHDEKISPARRALRSWKRSAGAEKGAGIRCKDSKKEYTDRALQKMRRVRIEQRHHHCGHQV